MALAPIEGTQSAPDVTSSVEDVATRKRRRAVQRQVRILFIYPVVYMMLRLIPFVQHCLNYSDYYATHPIFVLSLLSYFCQTTLGFVDVSIFCWRDRPWFHIQASDGTVLGSFFLRQFCRGPKWRRKPG